MHNADCTSVEKLRSPSKSSTRVQFVDNLRNYSNFGRLNVRSNFSNEVDGAESPEDMLKNGMQRMNKKRLVMATKNIRVSIIFANVGPKKELTVQKKA